MMPSRYGSPSIHPTYLHSVIGITCFCIVEEAPTLATFEASFHI
jgi:hypothetical protein